MLEIIKTVLPSPEQWEIIIEGMRNPMNSWDKIDSDFGYIEKPGYGIQGYVDMGLNDYGLMKRLAKGGPVHAKYRRMIPVTFTVRAPTFCDWIEQLPYSEIITIGG